MTPIPWEWLGCMPYDRAHSKQQERRRAVIAGEQQEVLWMLEHEPVITTGRRTVPNLISAAQLLSQGIALEHTQRGGLATFHCQGQLTVYAIVNCWQRGLGVKGAVHALEQGVIDWLSTLGLRSTRRPNAPGVWLGQNKICAVGMHFRAGVSMHGLSINLINSLDGFDLITPCGITNGGVTTLKAHIGNAPSPREAAPILAPHLLHHLHKPSCTIRKGSQQGLTVPMSNIKPGVLL